MDNTNTTKKVSVDNGLTMEERFQEECCTVLNTGGIPGMGVEVNYLKTLPFIKTELTRLMAEIVKQKTMAADIVSDVNVVSIEDIEAIAKSWGISLGDN